MSQPHSKLLMIDELGRLPSGGSANSKHRRMRLLPSRGLVNFAQTKILTNPSYPRAFILRYVRHRKVLTSPSSSDKVAANA